MDGNGTLQHLNVEALLLQIQELSITGEERIALYSYCANLVYSSYLSTGALVMIEAAISLGKLAVAQSDSEDESEIPSTLNNLGIHLITRFKRLGRLDDLEEAIRISRRAVEVTPADSMDLAACLNNLGNMLESRFERLGRLDDLEEAIRVSRRAVEVTPADSMDLAGRLNNLGSKLQRRFERLGRPEDDRQTTEMYLRAWNLRNAVPLHRLRAARACVVRLCGKLKYCDANEIAGRALQLLPTLSTRALSHSDRQSIVREFSGLAGDVCALRLQCGGPSISDVEEALELLEIGRGSLLGLAFEDRIDFEGLRQSHPRHAARLEELRAMLNKPARIEGISVTTVSQTSPFEVLQEFNACIEHIRSLPGFESFMKAPTIQDMKAAAADGPIVVVNVSSVRCDAILVTSGSISSIRLQDLDIIDLRRWLAKIRGWSRGTQDLEHWARQNARYRVFLSWLWKCCVRPITASLGYRAKLDSNTLPRIRWIGSGLASSLPFHAAGSHREGSRSSTRSIAVSSYIPTIRSLIHARGRAVHSSNSLHQHRLLSATMSTTPGRADLAGVQTEASAIVEAVAGRCQVTHCCQSSADTILRLMSSHDIFHFAGHGISDPEDPAQSCLIFEKDGQSGTERSEDRLSVQQLFETDFQPALLAFLSACSTAENKAEDLADESIHIGSGFLVAGFRHVVGCLWPSMDQVCVDVAREFYAQLDIGRGHRSLDDAVFARALHGAVGKILENETMRRSPLLWAQYIHIGA